MNNIDPNATKYLVKAKIVADGVVEKPDVEITLSDDVNSAIQPGATIATLKAVDADEDDSFTYELVADDFQICPCCGVSFQDFRRDGLLGCAADYSTFRELLEPLLASIHGSTRHVGKRARSSATSNERNASLVRLRNELRDAVEVEDYERASLLRDQILALQNAPNA